MTSYYRFFAGIGGVLGVNIAAKIFNITGDFVIGSHLAESVFVIALVGLLLDLGIGKSIRNNYLYIWITAVILGIFWQVSSFSALFFAKESQIIFEEWMKISPVVIGFVGIPLLMIADRIGRGKLIFGQATIGARGLVLTFAVAIAYAIFAIWVLHVQVGLI